jgi:hypothetical protein
MRGWSRRAEQDERDECGLLHDLLLVIMPFAAES